MVILSTDVLLWLRAVTEDTIHLEIEMEKQMTDDINNTGKRFLLFSKHCFIYL